MIRRLQRGDTIVEVLIALAVVGMVLGASYATATRAQRTGRYAQEQTEALKVAESQIEKLKYIATIDPLTIPAPADIFNASAGQNIFCIRNADFNKVITTAATPHSECTNLGTGSLYTVMDTYDNTGGNDLFTIEVSWDRQGNVAKGSVKIAYRLHKL